MMLVQNRTVSARLIASFTLVLGTLLLGACNKHNPVRFQETGVPVGVFQDNENIKNVFDGFANRESLENSIFKPEFVNFMIAVNREESSVDIYKLQQTIKRWNAISVSKKEQIKFKPLHFHRLAGLSDNNEINCTETNECVIDLRDIIILRWWQNLKMHYQTTASNQNDVHQQIRKLNPDIQPNLNQALKQIYSSPLGNKLISDATSKGVIIKVRKLDGQHGYFNPGRNLVVVDPKVLNYEFNYRYLVHELVHAIHQHDSNSVTEEVLAEIIGLEVQNQVTGVYLTSHPYNTFIQHILHEDYGKLPINSNIYYTLNQARIIH